MGSITKESDYYNEHREKFKIAEPFDVNVDWYTGDKTTETVVADDSSTYYFLYERNQSHYAPHSWCTKITK